MRRASSRAGSRSSAILISSHPRARTRLAARVLRSRRKTRGSCSLRRPFLDLEPDEARVGQRVGAAREVIEESRELVEEILGLVTREALHEAVQALEPE